MKKKITNCFLASSLLAVSSISLFGCFPEDEDNWSPEDAFRGGTRSFQLWTGNEDHPENPFGIPWANGEGSCLGWIDLDNWLVSLFDPETWEVGDVAYFQVWFYAQPGFRGGVRWYGRETFAPADDEWHVIDPGKLVTNNSSEPTVITWTVPVEDAYLLYSLQVIGSEIPGAPSFDYRFGLIPVYNE